MQKKVYLSPEGVKKLQDELAYLEGDRRQEVATMIQVAKDQGDLSENAEYAAAKELQSITEGRILELKEMLKNVEVIEQGSKGSTIVIGSTVEVETDGDVMTFEIVGSSEVDPSKGKISNESPIGKALIGKRKGDTINVKVPAGSIEYKIREIN